MTDFLQLYLNDHLRGATAGLELFKRASSHQPKLAPVTHEVGEDRDALLAIMRAVGARPNRLKVAAGWSAEKVGRAKTNGAVLTRSPLSDLIELEGLVVGLRGKVAGFRLLKALDHPALDGAELERLITRTERQAEQVEQLRLAAGAAVLTPHSG